MVKSKLLPHSGFVALRQLNPIHKKEPCFFKEDLKKNMKYNMDGIKYYNFFVFLSDWNLLPRYFKKNFLVISLFSKSIDQDLTLIVFTGTKTFLFNYWIYFGICFIDPNLVYIFCYHLKRVFFFLQELIFWELIFVDWWLWKYTFSKTHFYKCNAQTTFYQIYCCKC